MSKSSSSSSLSISKATRFGLQESGESFILKGSFVKDEIINEVRRWSMPVNTQSQRKTLDSDICDIYIQCTDKSHVLFLLAYALISYRRYSSLLPSVYLLVLII